MRKITKVRLINFQCYVDRTFKFCPTTNGIIGDNNSGKSSLVRAIYWGSNNAPAGDWMRRFDPEGQEGERLTAEVHIFTDDNNVFKRIKGDSRNEYWLNDEKFTSVGRSGVPLPIAELLGTVQLPFGKNLIPFIAMQDELPFMVFESAPAKGALLNYLTGVDVGDRMRKALRKESRALTVSINANIDTIATIDGELEKLDGFLALEKRLKKLKALDIKHQQDAGRIETLKKIQAQLSKLETKEKQYTKWLKRAIKTANQISGYVAIEEVLEQAKQYRHANTRLTVAKACETRLKALGKLISTHTAQVDRCSEIHTLAEQRDDWEDDVCGKKALLAKLLKEEEEYDVCTKCGGAGVKHYEKV